MNILNMLDSRDWDIVSYQALHMAVQLQKMGHNVILMCPDGTKLYAEAQKNKISVRALNIRTRLGFFEESLYDIVHIYDSASANAMMLKKLCAGTRVFVSQIKLGGKKTLERLKSIEPYVIRFMASCPSVQDDFCRAVIDPAKTFIVPPAINIGRWESAMLIKPAMFEKRPYKVGLISMDKSLKEQEFFLKVAKSVLQKLPETNFMVVGLNDDKIRDMARSLYISDKVDVLYERNDIPEVMAMMHIFVKTSVRDGLSMALIEAQASGVACVLPRLRGLSDFTVHERNGLLVEPGNADAYVQSIVHLIENPQLCHTISKMAFDQVNFNMSVPAVANLLERLYEDAMNSPLNKPDK